MSKIRIAKNKTRTHTCVWRLICMVSICFAVFMCRAYHDAGDMYNARARTLASCCVCNTYVKQQTGVCSKHYSNAAHSEKIRLSFDRLFPQTPFEELLDSCTQAYGLCRDFDVLYKTKSQECDLNIFTDLLVGKLFCIKKSIPQVLCQRPRVHKEDLSYLSELCDTILCDYKVTCSTLMHKPKTGYVACLIRDIKLKLGVRE